MRSVTLTEKLIKKGSTAIEYCTNKVRFASAGKGRKDNKGKVTGRITDFHAWFVSRDNGFLVAAAWLYLKVNNVHVKATQESSDWTTAFSIVSTDIIEMCVRPRYTDENLELQFQAKLT